MNSDTVLLLILTLTHRLEKVQLFLKCRAMNHEETMMSKQYLETQYIWQQYLLLQVEQ